MSWGRPAYARWTVSQPLVRPPRTSRTELLHLAIAYGVLVVDMTIILGGAGLLYAGGTAGGLARAFAPLTVAVAAIAALTGFVAHEMAHKLAAQRRGVWAEFRMSPFGLILSLVTATVGFLFAAPGATVVGGLDDRAGWGRTALAGPASNFGFAAAFLIGAAVTQFVSRAPVVVGALLLLTFFNAWFGTFNLIPFDPIDGAKVRRWNTAIWGLALGVGVVLTIYSYLSLATGAFVG